MHDFWKKGHVQNPEIIEMMGLENSHISKSKSYEFKLEQNNPTEYLCKSSPSIYHENNPQIPTNDTRAFVPRFSGFSIGIL